MLVVFCLLFYFIIYCTCTVRVAFTVYASCAILVVLVRSVTITT